MQNFLRFSGLAAAALALAALAPGAVAQELQNHDLCRQTSTYPPEQLGDRDGHMLNYGLDSCETVEGVTKGPFGPAISCGNGMDPRRKS